MEFIRNKDLLDALAALHTNVISVSAERETFTDPEGKAYENLPSFLRVTLASTPGERSDIRHELWLPDAWNGVFLGTGNGGIAGVIRYHTLAAHLRSGYAVINTDLGTSAGRDCGIGNPDVWRDFGWRATDLMTRAGKLVTEARYGRPIDYAYFWGGSTGGQQAMSLVQRFPEAYDGIIANVPASNRTHMHAFFLWAHNLIRKSGAEPFTEEVLAEVTACAVDYGRLTGVLAQDALFFANPPSDAAFIDGFVAYLKENLPSLSDEQRTLLHQFYRGPVNPRTGERIYCGFPIGAESGREIISWQRKEAPRTYVVRWGLGADYLDRDFDPDADVDRLDDLLAADMNANNPDLRPFFSHGGKLLIYSGSADPIVFFPEALNYYARMTEAVGGVDAALEGARLFLVPGQDHRASLTRYGAAMLNGAREIRSALHLLRLWREQGIAPDSLEVVTESGDVQGRMMIYPYGSGKNPITERPACAERYLRR